MWQHFRLFFLFPHRIYKKSAFSLQMWLAAGHRYPLFGHRNLQAEETSTGEGCCIDFRSAGSR